MFKSLLLVLALGSASAGTIATVSCDGNIVSGLPLATCNGAHSFALAEVDGLTVSAQVSVGAGDTLPTYANASLSGTYLFTVTGGTGGGFFLPCIGAASYGVGNASASFNSYSIGPTRLGNDICTFEGLTSASPFVYGVGQTVDISFSGSAPGACCGASGGSAGLGDFGGPLTPFEFWDSQGNPVSNGFFLTLIPEPGSFAVLGVAFVMLAIARHRRRIDY